MASLGLPFLPFYSSLGGGLLAEPAGYPVRIPRADSACTTPVARSPRIRPHLPSSLVAPRALCIQLRDRSTRAYRLRSEVVLHPAYIRHTTVGFGACYPALDLPWFRSVRIYALVMWIWVLQKAGYYDFVPQMKVIALASWNRVHK